jgi:hypothetical protein
MSQREASTDSFSCPFSFRNKLPQAKVVVEGRPEFNDEASMHRERPTVQFFDRRAGSDYNNPVTGFRPRGRMWVQTAKGSQRIQVKIRRAAKGSEL